MSRENCKNYDNIAKYCFTAIMNLSIRCSSKRLYYKENYYNDSFGRTLLFRSVGFWSFYPFSNCQAKIKEIVFSIVFISISICRVIGRLILLWGLSFGLAAAPLLPIHYFGAHFYGTNGVCLSLYIHEPYAQVKWSEIAFVFN